MGRNKTKNVVAGVCAGDFTRFPTVEAATEDFSQNKIEEAGPPTQSQQCYLLEELLAGSDFSQPLAPEEREWLNAPPVGRELL